jgi:hypothetical protein
MRVVSRLRQVTAGTAGPLSKKTLQWRLGAPQQQDLAGAPVPQTGVARLTYYYCGKEGPPQLSNFCGARSLSHCAHRLTASTRDAPVNIPL